MTFIIDDGVAIPCECRGLRLAEDILNKSGIGKEFRNKRFDNFYFSKSMATMIFLTVKLIDIIEIS